MNTVLCSAAAAPDNLTDRARGRVRQMCISSSLALTCACADVELSLELAGTALHIATGYHFDVYGEAYVQQVRIRARGRGWGRLLEWWLVRVLCRVVCGRVCWGPEGPCLKMRCALWRQPGSPALWL